MTTKFHRFVTVTNMNTDVRYSSNNGLCYLLDSPINVIAEVKDIYYPNFGKIVSYKGKQNLILKREVEDEERLNSILVFLPFANLETPQKWSFVTHFPPSKSFYLAECPESYSGFVVLSEGEALKYTYVRNADYAHGKQTEKGDNQTFYLIPEIGENRYPILVRYTEQEWDKRNYDKEVRKNFNLK
jgi:hypothetical protein